MTIKEKMEKMLLLTIKANKLLINENLKKIRQTNVYMRLI